MEPAPWAHVPSGSALYAVSVRSDEPFAESHSFSRVDFAGRGPRVHAQQIAELIGVFVSEPCDVRLIEQSDVYRTVIALEVRGGFLAAAPVPLWFQRIGAEMSDQSELPVSGENFQLRHEETYYLGLRIGEDDPRLVGGAPPARSGTVDMPGSVHQHVGVDRPVPDTDQKMLPGRLHRRDRLTGKVERAERRGADLELS